MRKKRQRDYTSREAEDRWRSLGTSSWNDEVQEFRDEHKAHRQ